MLNPKAVRVKNQLNKVKKGESSTEGFPKTDYTKSFNEFIGIDKLTSNTTQTSKKKEANTSSAAFQYKAPFQNYTPIGVDDESYITPEQQAENKVLADIDAYKKRNLAKGIAIEYTPEQIKNKIKIQLQLDSDDRAYEYRAKAIALTDDEEAQIDSEYKYEINESFSKINDEKD
jgi:hypothetical protein